MLIFILVTGLCVLFANNRVAKGDGIFNAAELGGSWFVVGFEGTLIPPASKIKCMKVEMNVTSENMTSSISYLSETDEAKTIIFEAEVLRSKKFLLELPNVKYRDSSSSSMTDAGSMQLAFQTTESLYWNWNATTMSHIILSRHPEFPAKDMNLSIYKNDNVAKIVNSLEPPCSAIDTYTFPDQYKMEREWNVVAVVDDLNELPDCKNWVIKASVKNVTVATYEGVSTCTNIADDKKIEHKFEVTLHNSVPPLFKLTTIDVTPKNYYASKIDGDLFEYQYWRIHKDSDPTSDIQFTLIVNTQPTLRLDQYNFIKNWYDIKDLKRIIYEPKVATIPPEFIPPEDEETTVAPTEEPESIESEPEPSYVDEVTRESTTEILMINTQPSKASRSTTPILLLLLWICF